MMRCSFFLAAVLAIASASVSQANYLIVRIILNPPPSTGNGTGGGALGMGGFEGNPVGNRGGAMGLGGPPPGIGGPPGAAMGMRGGPPPGIGGPPGGNGGFLGAPAGNMMGGFGGPPPGVGGNPMGNGGPKVDPKNPPKMSTSDYVMVALEFKDKEMTFGGYIDGNKKTDSLIKTKWGGRLVVYQDGQEILVQPLKLPTPHEQYLARYPRVRKNPEDYLKFAQWCLSVGLVDECQKILDEFVKQVEARDKDPKEKEGLDKFKAVAEIYNKLKPELARGVQKKDTAAAWKTRLGQNYTTTDNEFYSLVHLADTGNRETVQNRLKLLDTTMKNFYLWHAMRGKALQLPAEKMVGILVDSEPSYRQLQSTFDSQSLDSDGFHARRDNLAIFYTGRLDLGYRNFASKVQSLSKEYKPDELMKAIYPKEAREVKARQDAARAAMLFTVDKALKEEAEIASTTHEGTRQLFAATGLLPRNVEIPEWLQFGLASVFEMPKGPFFGDFADVKVALWPGVGAPNWAYMGHFNELIKKKEMPSALEALEATISDDFFAMARLGIKSRKEVTKLPTEPEKLEALKEALTARAKSASWGLAYYLANDRLDDLHKYFAELSQMPRDLELDENSKKLAFARAFGLARADLNGEVMDLRRATGLSAAWIQYMATLRSPTADLKLDDVTAPDPNGAPGGMGPGGMGPGAGGGGAPGRE